MSTPRSSTPKSAPRSTPRFLGNFSPRSITRPSSTTTRSTPSSTPRSSPRTDVNTDTSTISNSTVDNESQPKMTMFKRCIMICSPSSSQAITPRLNNPHQAHPMEATTPKSDIVTSSRSATPKSQTPHGHTPTMISSEDPSLTAASSSEETSSSHAMVSAEVRRQVETSSSEATTTVIVIPRTLTEITSSSRSQGEVTSSPTTLSSSKGRSSSNKDYEEGAATYTPTTTESSCKEEKSLNKDHESESDDGEVKRIRCIEVVSFNLDSSMPNPNETVSHYSMTTSTASRTTTSRESGEICSPPNSSSSHQQELEANVTTTTDSATQMPMGGVSEERQPVKTDNSSVSDLEHNRNQFVTAADLDSVLDGFDSEEREEIQKSLANQLLQIGAVQALEKVSRIAQSSLKRLQNTVKEKDEVILNLHGEIQSVYKVAMDQQERDQRDLEHLHGVFRSSSSGHDHQSHSSQENKPDLGAMRATLQQLEAGDGLAGQVAGLFDRYLHDLTSRHESQSSRLQGNVNILKNRCEELEASLEREKQHNLAGQSHLHSKLSDNVADCEKAKAQSESLGRVVTTLKHQLNEKDADLKAFGESVQTLSGLLEEEKERQSGITDDFERMTSDARRTLNKVTAVNQQLKQLKHDTSRHQMQGRAAEAEVKSLKDKLKGQNDTVHKLSVELAAQRRKTLKAVGKAARCKECRNLREACNQEQQFLRGCVTALTAQVLELRDRPHASTAVGGGARDGRCNDPSARGDATEMSMPPKHGNENRLERSNGPPIGRQCDHVFLTASYNGNDQSCPHEFIPMEDPNDCFHEYAILDNKPHSDSACSHVFVPANDEIVCDDSKSDNALNNHCLKRQRGTPVSLEDAHSSPKRLQAGAKVTANRDFQSSFHGLVGSDTDSPQALVEKALSLEETETIKKLEAHDKLTKRVDFLQKRLDNCKQAMRGSQTELDRSDATVQQLKSDLRNARGTITELEAKMQRKTDARANFNTDSVKIKALLDNIEMLELERTLLKHDLMVQKSRQIARLETQLRTARALERHEDPSFGRARSHGLIIEGEAAREHDRRSSLWEKEKSDLESAVASRDSQILELTFEVDQATWKLGQVEKRFQILFGALDCKRLDFDAPVADTLLESLFSPKKLDLPVLAMLKEKILSRRGYSRSGSRVKELEALVEALMKVTEKVSNENDNLQRSCEDAIKYMEKNKELRKVVEDLQQKIANGERSSPGRLDSAQEAIIADLKSQISGLVEANAGLLTAMREMEEQCSGLKEMVHKHYIEGISNMAKEDAQKLRKSKRICFSEAEHREQDDRLHLQTNQIQILEQDLAIQGQIIRDLNKRLEKKEDELDFVHGKLSLEMVDSRCENIQQRGNDLWSFAQGQNEQPENRDRAPEEYFDDQYLVEHEYDLLQEENRRLENCVKSFKNPELVEEIRHMKSEQKRLAKVCDQYEELLRIYARQIGTQFSSLRK